MEKIYGSIPVDKKSAILTNQKGCSPEKLSQSQLLENLQAKARLLMEQIRSLPKSSPGRKVLGWEYTDLCLKISKLKPRKTKVAEEHFIDAAKDILPNDTFWRIMGRAMEKEETEPEKISEKIFDDLPGHLHIVRNPNAEPWDRWRFYNKFTGKFIEPGRSTIGGLMETLNK